MTSSIKCPTCQRELTCYSCSKNTQGEQKPSRENIELTGTLQMELGKRMDKNGKDFFFGKLILENSSEKTIFFFDPAPDLFTRLQNLKGGQTITVEGFKNMNETFTVTNLNEELDVFV